MKMDFHIKPNVPYINHVQLPFYGLVKRQRDGIPLDPMTQSTTRGASHRLPAPLPWLRWQLSR